MAYAVSQSAPRQRLRGRLPAVLGVARRAQTYRNLLYLIASFPLGLAYSAFLITGLSMGVGTLIVWIGVPILLVMVLAWWGLGAFERELAIWWLGVEIRPMARPRTAELRIGGRLKAHLTSQVTWTSLVYLFAKFPLGLFSFVLITMLLGFSARLLATPLPYLLDLVAGEGIDPQGVVIATAAPVLGAGLGLGTLHLANALAFVSGRFARLMLGLSDVSERLTQTQAVAERERSKAERAEQSRSELIVNVSHELRTPIASIRGHVESLLLASEGRPADAPAPPETRHYLDIVHRETERLGALVDDLLALARAESGELRLDLAPTDATAIVEEVYQTLMPLARRERQITLVRDVTPDLPRVLADRQRLGQVLLNLARNAITYTPTGGIVSITLSRAPTNPDFLLLTVADTGIGIAPEDLDRIFERFYRTDASRARTSGGFGLGLAIVRDLVTAMGGSVRAESTPGEGSRFHVMLRIAGGSRVVGQSASRLADGGRIARANPEPAPESLPDYPTTRLPD